MHGSHAATSQSSVGYVQDHTSAWNLENESSHDIPPTVSRSAPEHYIPMADTHMSDAHEAFHQPTLSSPPTESPSPPRPLPPHREWDDLSTLAHSEITTHMHALTQRCKTTHEALTTALANLRLSTQLFLAVHRPLTHAQVTAYAAAYAAAQTAGRALFAPQEAYRSALATLGMFVSDVIDALPRASAVKERLKRELDEGMHEANGKEEEVRTAMRRLAEETRKGGERFGLAVYVGCVGERERNWTVLEGRLRTWAEMGVWAGEAGRGVV